MSDFYFLIVDDNYINRKIAKGFLNNMSFNKIDFAEDGVEALEKCKINNYDIIILDLMMPVMDGFEFLREFIKIRKHEDIIIHTAAVSKNYSDYCKQLGMVYFMNKPIDKNILKNLIETIAKNKKQ